MAETFTECMDKMDGGTSFRSVADVNQMTVTDDFEALASNRPPEHEPIVEAAHGGCLFERGDKGEIIAPSKCRKSWMAMDLALHIAAGKDFLEFHVPKPRRVFYFNLEIKDTWQTDRLYKRLGHSNPYGIDPKALNGQLFFMNARGLVGFELQQKILAVCASSDAKPDVVIIDPRYKLMEPGSNENAGEDMAQILNFYDQVANAGPAIIIVSHDGKGCAGERDIRDRGAGSSWAARDCDFRWALTPHAKDSESMAVVTTLARNCAPVQDFSVDYYEGYWRMNDEPATPETLKSRQSKLNTNTDGKTADAEQKAREAIYALVRNRRDGITKMMLIGKVVASARVARRVAGDMVREAEEADAIRFNRGDKNSLFVSEGQRGLDAWIG